MLTLLTYPRHGAVFSLSPFCVKAALLLTYAGQHWRREDLSDPRGMPHRKLPVLRTPSGLVSDSGMIRRYLEQQGVEFDPGLSPRDRAFAGALIRMAEDTLYFYVVQDRWDNDAVWPTLRDTYFTEIPALVRRPVTAAIRRSVHRGLQFQGTGRFTEAERKARLEDILRMLNGLLEDSPFLMGARVTSADFSVAAMLQAMRSTMVETDAVRRVSGDPVLSAYIDRMFHDTVVLP